MLIPSWTDVHLLYNQIPLFPGSARIGGILENPRSEFERICRLLNDWTDKYGKVSIQVDQTAILVGENRIALEDVTPKNALKNWIKTLSNVSFSPRGDLLTTKPWLIDLVEPEAWMALIDAIPGIWAERRDNLLELLGNECFSHQDDDFYRAIYGDGYDVYFAYHTNEPLWNDDGQYYWQLFIRSFPIQMNARNGSDYMDEYTGTDQKMRDWGDEYIHFDVFHVTGVIYDVFPSPAAAMRLKSQSTIETI